MELDLHQIHHSPPLVTRPFKNVINNYFEGLSSKQPSSDMKEFIASYTKRQNFTASLNWLYRHSFRIASLRSVLTDLDNNTFMHCWVPKTPIKSKPNLILIHGFGANATRQYHEHLRHFTDRFNVYVPDLLFFGDSYTRMQPGTNGVVPG
ncbi:hypothetical protein Dsin_006596 [Dipteronia sinensis]|uniref:Uncharacterized protein n=1 Tax=Dipteronia sinensis TaxID=43782 RepID=A0AAE0EG18_9ROSI|nr:hypothetical protein Dsin_006596 [Dipteronia sinensis]